uniref:AlNc14C432G11597 protein n=1 Tax=Albugo laibachii Nc14 TaxID=890382 RepID=F0WZK6_9STRA|nr:AlNc14C432G11597 [Albugo laibachii Nc14]|eukprot:CCA26930.1 AlNc14C432G11597 [Albugo laibachii Nc14]
MDKRAYAFILWIESANTQDIRAESDERSRSRPNDCIATQIFVPVEDECAFHYDKD